MVKVFCKPRGSGAMGSGCPNLVFGEFGGRRGVLKAGLEKVNGGKGFHYFLRDVITTLIDWFAKNNNLVKFTNNQD